MLKRLAGNDFGSPKVEISRDCNCHFNETAATGFQSNYLLEYEWASTFLSCDDLALDTTTFVGHSFKDYLLNDHKKNCNSELIDRIQTVEDVKDVIVAHNRGPDAEDSLPSHYFTNSNFNKNSLRDLPYSGQQFDKIYCLSVLQHFDDSFNKWPMLRTFHQLLPGLTKQIGQVVAELTRILKPGGLILFTFDDSLINLKYFYWLLSTLHLKILEPANIKASDDKFFSQKNKLDSYYAVIRKE